MEAVNTLIIQPNEDGYRKILESALDSVFVIHGDSYLYVNKQGARMLGYDTPGQMIGKSMFDHTYVDDHALVRERANLRQRGEQVPSRYEINLVRRNGERFPAEVHVSYIEYDGKACSLSYTRDITDRKKHEERLQVLHLFTAQMALSYDIDEIERITYNTISQVLGLNRGSLGFVNGNVLTHQYRWNMKIGYIYHMPLDGPGITIRAVKKGNTQLVSDVLEDPEYVNGGEDELATRSELAVPIKIREKVIGVINLEKKEVEAFSENDVKIVEILAVHIGIAMERIQYLEELDRVRQNKDRELIESFKRFSSMIRHDLNGPMSTIVNSTYLIEKKPRSLDSPIRLIKTSIEVLDSILQDWSQKIYSQVIQKNETNLNKLIQDSLQAIIIPDNITVKQEIPKNLTYNLDERAILRVIINLIKNAVEAMPEGGDLSIGVEVKDDNLILKVSDNGTGIEKEAQEKVFTPFYTSKEMGSGLGLAYCKQAVEAHDGKISFESEQGKGTVFIVQIPN